MTGGGEPAPELVEFALRLADAAGAVVRKYYRAPITVESKADASPVTAADREAEQVLRALIRATYPEHGIDGEEFAGERLDAEFVWRLDPIDGTKSFVIGRPLFGTLIALTRVRPILGVIDQCILGERWLGAAGQGSTWNGRPIRVRACPALGQAVLSVTSPQMFSAAERAARRPCGKRGALSGLRRRLLRLWPPGDGLDRPDRRGGSGRARLHGAGTGDRGRGRPRHRLAGRRPDAALGRQDRRRRRSESARAR